MKEKKPRCYNCKYKSDSFKIGKLTHLHCMNPNIYKIEGFKSGQTSAWDTLRVFGDTCDKHEFEPLILHDVSGSNDYWMICQSTYIIEGVEVPKGRMKKIKKGNRGIMNPDWRKATDYEVRTKQWYKGNYFNLTAWK